MAKKSKTRRGGRKMPLLATAGVGIFALNAYQAWREQGIPGVKYRVFGIQNDGKFDPVQATAGLSPVILGAVGSKAASKFGLNRAFAGMPVFKL